ncbi:MAG: hypothetical protein ACF8TS_05690 [Maioricimonas sp. JB049]
MAEIIETTLDALNELTPDPQNARTSTERSRKALAESLHQHGLARSIVVDADGIVRAGNQTLAAAQAAGVRKVLLVKSNGGELVAVRRSDLRGDRAVSYALADNRTAELSEWHKRNLEAAAAEVRGAGIDVDLTIGFTRDELADMLRESVDGLDDDRGGRKDADGNGSGADDEPTGEKNPHVEKNAGDQSGRLRDRWQVIVWCESDSERERLERELHKQGRTFRRFTQ